MALKESKSDSNKIKINKTNVSALNKGKREAARKKIMDSALELFALKGFHTTTISDIAEHAGISKGLMYNYFQSKEELLREIVIFGADTAIYSLDKNRDGVLTKEELIYFIRKTFSLLRKNRNFWKLFYSIIHQPAVIGLTETNISDRLENYSKIIIDYFQREGAEDPLNEMRLLTAIIDGIALGYLMSNDAYTLDKLKDKVIKMYS
ncbi:MAG: TetR/AcrR family transcriptional regulator [Bacteroidales bacterium]|nr:TetR/AcrR family transcriptional regulator [Bacteroidales bacterium]MDD2426274.1 TetR/AcrR family transcriptional regulator [Bacteroidales bacterium]MDD3989894.1 TetR/AcrR family transcriptional regulator [Bacteroidales bacterium]MDD4638458.1 TetR/AcrR family transcriptional regulator [Bacteroidales bacterium]